MVEYALIISLVALLSVSALMLLEEVFMRVYMDEVTSAIEDVRS